MRSSADIVHCDQQVFLLQIVIQPAGKMADIRKGYHMLQFLSAGNGSDLIVQTFQPLRMPGYIGIFRKDCRIQDLCLYQVLENMASVRKLRIVSG